jgi:hypothetical protein
MNWTTLSRILGVDSPVITSAIQDRNLLSELARRVEKSDREIAAQTKTKRIELGRVEGTRVASTAK